MDRTAVIDRDAERFLKKLRKIYTAAEKRGDTELGLESLTAMASIEYIYNQEYRDEFIEDKILGSQAEPAAAADTGAPVSSVLFYDGFGFDLRGLAQVYLSALIKLGYRVVYVTKAASESDQPQIMKILGRGGSVVYNADMPTFSGQLELLRKIFADEEFQAAFFYTTPYDISGAFAFRGIAGKCRRYLINLTDHAFWAGRSAVDHCIEFRDYGASISEHYRGFAKEQLLELPYYPILNKEIPFRGFPPETRGKKIIFSGGTLYKTIDEAGTYYSLVGDIVRNREDTAFIYAGSGDDTYIRRLAAQYPDRVFFIPERDDLYQVLRHSDLYLNTYPVGGAMMLQFAAMASCVPIMLKRAWDDDMTGVLRNEDRLGEIFTDREELIAEAGRLLDDEAYRKTKQALLDGMVISEEDFINGLDMLIQHPASPYAGRDLPEYDTRRYRAAFRETVCPEDLRKCIISRKTKGLIKYFPKELLVRAFIFAKGKLKRK